MATVAQMGAAGAMDEKINPKGVPGEKTLWRFKWNRHTNFSLESIYQPFTPSAFGANKMFCTLIRQGDLLYRQYLRFELPAIQGYYKLTGDAEKKFSGTPDAVTHDESTGMSTRFPTAGDDSTAGTVGFCTEPGSSDLGGVCDPASGPYAHWVQAIGQHLVQECTIHVGAQEIDRVNADILYMWEELAGQPGKRLKEMIGKRDTREELIAASAKARVLYVPLPWWFCRHPGNALPVITLAYHNIRLTLSTSRLDTCIQRKDKYTWVEQFSGRPGADAEGKALGSGKELTDDALQAAVESEFIFLDNEERNAFANASFEHLIVQHNTINHNVKGTQGNNVALNFNHPVLELIWRAQMPEQRDAGNHFNYSGYYGEDPITSVEIKFNNMHRVDSREAAYFRTVQPYQHHTNIPRSYVYCYSFALYPESSSPSGSANFSRIDNVEMKVNVQDEIVKNSANLELMFLARNWNLVTYKSGMAGLMFAN